MSSPPSQSTPAFGTSSFGQPAAASAPTPGNPFSAPGSTAFGGSSAFPSQTANQGAPKNPFGPTSSGGDGPSNGPFGSFPSSFNPSAGPPAQTYTFGATVPPASSTGASVRTGFGGAAGALSASAPFGGSSNTMSFSTPSSGPAATAFGSATGMGGAFGFGATPNQSAPSGFGVAQPRFGAPTLGVQAQELSRSGLHHKLRKRFSEPRPWELLPLVMALVSEAKQHSRHRYAGASIFEPVAGSSLHH